MLKKKNKYVLAIAGADSVIGRELLEILEDRNFPLSGLKLLGSEDSEGERLEFQGRGIALEKISNDSFGGVDIAIFSGDAGQSREFAPPAAKSGAIVIDNSGAFGSDPKIPLVVPEVNGHAAGKHTGIIASPASSTIAMVMALKPIHDAAKIRRVVVTTFLSVSGTGKKAIDELAQQTVALLNFRDVGIHVYPHQIAFNCLPHVDSFFESGYTAEEVKMVHETKKILEDDSMRVTATAVRVPVFRCHSASVNIETEKKISANEARSLLSAAPGLVVYDDPGKNLYPLAIDSAGKDEIYVGRIREDDSIPNGINFWIVSDNLRKGSALNAVQIAEELISSR